MARYDKELTPAEIAAVKDEDNDFSDIAELGDSFWREAELIQPDRTERVTLRVKRSVLEYFRARARGRGYQTRMNRVLERYVRAQRGSRWELSSELVVKAPPLSPGAAWHSGRSGQASGIGRCCRRAGPP